MLPYYLGNAEQWLDHRYGCVLQSFDIAFPDVYTYFISPIFYLGYFFSEPKARDAELHDRMSNNARSYISNHHSMTAVSKEYVEFLLKCAQTRSAQIRLITDFAGN